MFRLYSIPSLFHINQLHVNNRYRISAVRKYIRASRMYTLLHCIYFIYCTLSNVHLDAKCIVVLIKYVVHIYEVELLLLNIFVFFNQTYCFCFAF